MLGNHQYIPNHEIIFTFARSSGAGGQNVNKTSTKVVARWLVGKSRAFSELEKDRIRSQLANRLNNDDELIVTAEEERSQPQNRERAVIRMQQLVRQALRVPKKRKPTRPTRSSKLKHLESKKLRSRVKMGRRLIVD